jgi:hypothetical protein
LGRRNRSELAFESGANERGVGSIPHLLAILRMGLQCSLDGWQQGRTRHQSTLRPLFDGHFVSRRKPKPLSALEKAFTPKTRYQSTLKNALKPGLKLDATLLSNAAAVQRDVRPEVGVYFKARSFQ